jgi:hypothetical protein
MGKKGPLLIMAKVAYETGLFQQCIRHATFGHKRHLRKDGF